ncbi:Thoeris anti-defense Tad2 family protein [Pediococcus pentosaceus]|uniref:Thoeris anti-defense Tad2 family protein n=1 Tax=Pediococcus pentosaceus TaxID=1255 RepID=UPI0018A136FE|nr:MW1434 family type I TA system toxin [Pediococcus pentosaceus]MBF7137229.1 DUF2829 domain-containing protein [Pediococcus pentosaceus]
MNIQEAIKEASKQKRGITRKSWGPNPIWMIPTNTTSCIVIMQNDKKISVRWNPRSQDITATDWIVYG